MAICDIVLVNRRTVARHENRIFGAVNRARPFNWANTASNATVIGSVRAREVAFRLTYSPSRHWRRTNRDCGGIASESSRRSIPGATTRPEQGMPTSSRVRSDSEPFRSGNRRTGLGVTSLWSRRQGRGELYWKASYQRARAITIGEGVIERNSRRWSSR